MWLERRLLCGVPAGEQVEVAVPAQLPDLAARTARRATAADLSIAGTAAWRIFRRYHQQFVGPAWLRGFDGDGSFVMRSEVAIYFCRDRRAGLSDAQVEQAGRYISRQLHERADAEGALRVLQDGRP